MQPFTAIAFIVLALIAAMQAIRVWFEWDVSLNGVAIPLWASWMALGIALTIAVGLWTEARASTSDA